MLDKFLHKEKAKPNWSAYEFLDCRRADLCSDLEAGNNLD